MTEHSRELRDWTEHLPAGMPAAAVDLAAGATLPRAWTAHWSAAPDRILLSTLDGVRVRADEFEERTRAAAHRYAGAGLAPGDRVLICAESSVEMLVSHVGALRAGLSVVPANPGYSADELEGLVRAAQPMLAVLDEASRVTAVRAVTPDLAGLPAGSAEVDAAEPADVALIIYTSGTTGKPKGVPLRHANLLASAHAVRLAWRWSPADTLVLCLPLFHVHGLGVGWYGTLTAGAGALLLPRFEPGAVADAISAGGSLLFGVPTIYHRMAASPYLDALRGLRLAVSGSAPLSPQLHEAVRSGSGQVVLERYGMSETVMLVSNPYQGERRPGTVGFPLPGVEVRLAPRPGGTQEVEVRGPNVISGYLDGAAAETFTGDGWLRTGDLGTVDDEGYLAITGRAKELIITGGFNVYPRDVEEVLVAHPGVADAAVVGAPSPDWGELVVAFIVPAAGADESLVDELVAWAQDRLVGYKRPREWRVVDRIPRTALGKILRHQLHS